MRQFFRSGSTTYAVVENGMARLHDGAWLGAALVGSFVAHVHANEPWVEVAESDVPPALIEQLDAVPSR